MRRNTKIRIVSCGIAIIITEIVNYLVPYMSTHAVRILVSASVSVALVWSITDIAISLWGDIAISERKSYEEFKRIMQKQRFLEARGEQHGD